jgi:hypothetical protein
VGQVAVYRIAKGPSFPPSDPVFRNVKFYIGRNSPTLENGCQDWSLKDTERRVWTTFGVRPSPFRVPDRSIFSLITFSSLVTEFQHHITILSLLLTGAKSRLGLPCRARTPALRPCWFLGVRNNGTKAAFDMYKT